MSGCHVPFETISKAAELFEKEGIDISTLDKETQIKLLKEFKECIDEELVKALNSKKDSYRKIHCTHCGKSTIISV